MRKQSFASALAVGVGLAVGAAVFTAAPTASAQKSAYIDPDKVSESEDRKVWQVGGIFETHRLVRQDDLSGAARNKALNYLYLYAGWDPTPKDRFQLRGGFYQRFLADQGETGVRADDLSLAYTRTIPLPWKIDWRVTGSMLAPISFESQLAGIITSPRLTFTFERVFGDLTLGLRASGAYYIVKYRQEPGGGANPRASTLVGASAEYAMPFHRPLSVGLNIQTGYYWLYDRASMDNPTLAQFGNAPVRPSEDPFLPTPPMNQTYGGEVFLKYVLPELVNVKSDLTLALAQGDSTLGYPGVIHDGRSQVYWMFRRSAQVYLALGVRY